MAAPFHTTDIALPPAVSDQIPQVPYVHLHVTLLTTTSPSANPTYFNLSAGSKVPAMMLTTDVGTRNGGKRPEFNSVSYHGLVREGEWAVKIFSKERISDGWLQQMFDGQVGWVHRKEVSTKANIYIISTNLSPLIVGRISKAPTDRIFSANKA